MTHTYTFDEEELNERYDLVTERIAEISRETTVPGAYGTYMHEVADFLANVAVLLSAHVPQDAAFQGEASTFQGKHDGISTDHSSKPETLAMQQIGKTLSADAYAASFLNPTYAIKQMGQEPGQLLSFVFADIVAMVGPAMEGRKDLVTLWMELFVMLYGEFTTELEDPLGSLVSKELMHELKDTVYWFYHDNAEVILWDLADRVVDTLRTDKTAHVNESSKISNSNPINADEPQVSNTSFSNLQFRADHREDRGFYLDKGFLLRCEEILTDIFTKFGRQHGRIEGVLDLQKNLSDKKQTASQYRISLFGIFEETKMDHQGGPIPSTAAIQMTQHQKKMEQDLKKHLAEICLEHTGIQLLL